jgi:hypothetical protein
MLTHTSYLTFKTKKRQEIIDITDEVEKCRAAAGISEGFVLVSAMHISASVFVNDTMNLASGKTSSTGLKGRWRHGIPIGIATTAGPARTTPPLTSDH